MTNVVPFPCQALADEVTHWKQYLATLPPTEWVVTGINPKTEKEEGEWRVNPEIADTNAKIREAEDRFRQCVDSFTKRADVRLEDTRAIIVGPGGLELQAPSVIAKLPNGQQVDLLAGRGAGAGDDVSKGLADLRAEVERLRAQELAGLRAEVERLRAQELAGLRADLDRLRSQVDHGLEGTSTTGSGVQGIGLSDDAGVKGIQGNPNAILFDERGAPIFEGGVPRTAIKQRSASGAFGWSEKGAGVHGASVAGPGVKAESRHGPALLVLGEAAFSRCGWAVIDSGKQTAEVPVALDTGTVVLAVAQGAGPEWVQSAWGHQAATSSIQIRLNQPASRSVLVGWFLVETPQARPVISPPKPPRPDPGVEEM